MSVPLIASINRLYGGPGRVARVTYGRGVPMPLTSAIDGVYAAFATVPRPTELSYCGTCCYSADEAAALLAPGPLREIPYHVLEYYQRFLLSTVGDVPDFRYFLPRLLELAAERDVDYETGHLFNRLWFAEWETWAERAVIREYLRAMWSRALFTAPDPGNPYSGAEEMLYAIAEAEPDITPYLVMWQESLTAPAPARHLAEMLAGRLGTSLFGEQSWDPVREAQGLRWLMGDALRHAVATAAVNTADAETQARLAAVAGEIEGLRAYLKERDA